MKMSVNLSTISPKQYRKQQSFEILYGFIQTQFGHCLLGINAGNICFLSFFGEGEVSTAIDNLKTDWPNAILKENIKEVAPVAKNVFDFANTGKSQNVLLRGTDLQVSVWKEITTIKEGTTVTYEKLAQAVGHPTAVRAVANAVAKNRVAYEIPCHRIVHKSGKKMKYRWGPECKVSMLKHEGAID